MFPRFSCNRRTSSTSKPEKKTSSLSEKILFSATDKIHEKKFRENLYDQQYCRSWCQWKALFTEKAHGLVCIQETQSFVSYNQSNIPYYVRAHPSTLVIWRGSGFGGTGAQWVNSWENCKFCPCGKLTWTISQNLNI